LQQPALQQLRFLIFGQVANELHTSWTEPAKMTKSRHLFSLGVRPLFLLLLALCVTAGCARLRQQEQFGIQQFSSTWKTNTERPVAGIDSGAATKVKLMAGDPAGVDFVLWSDRSEGMTGRVTGGRGTATYAWEISTKKLKPFKIVAHTNDGNNGSVTVDGQEFDLAAGRLIMISTETGELAVRQSRIPIDKLEVVSDELRNFAVSQPEFADFYGRLQSEYAARNPPEENLQDDDFQDDDFQDDDFQDDDFRDDDRRATGTPSSAGTRR